MPDELTETLVLGGAIRPDAAGRSVSAMLVRGERVVAVGTEAECRAHTVGRPAVVDVAGATVLPGFVDAHCHPLMHGQFASWVDCSWEAAPAIADVVRALRVRADH